MVWCAVEMIKIRIQTEVPQDNTDKGHASRSRPLSLEAVDPPMSSPATHILLVVAVVGVSKSLLQLRVNLLGGGSDGHTGPSDARHGGLPGDDVAGGPCRDHGERFRAD